MIVRISILDTIINLYKPRILGQLYQICIKITILGQRIFPVGER